MKSTGVVRRVDELGRIVIPIELRRTLDIAEKDALEIYVDGEQIILKKYEPACIFCGDARDVINYKGKNICKNCMEELKLGTVESKFADIIWENEPISSGQLVKLCGQQLDWKKSTTYTMLKRLCERGLFQNEKGMVSALMTKEEFGAAQSEKIIEESFEGSLPAFIAAFTSRKKLSPDDVNEIQKMIDSYRVEGE